jgi:hypothetical protein
MEQLLSDYDKRAIERELGQIIKIQPTTVQAEGGRHLFNIVLCSTHHGIVVVPNGETCDCFVPGTLLDDTDATEHFTDCFAEMIREIKGRETGRLYFYNGSLTAKERADDCLSMCKQRRILESSNIEIINPA